MKRQCPLLVGLILAYCTSLFAQGSVIEVPFEFYKNELVAEVMINGKGPFMMMLDTGTDPSAIDLATADVIGIKRSGKGERASGGGTDKNIAFECKLRNVELGGLKAGTIEAAAIDLSKVSERMGKHIDGVIGYSLFKKRIVQFDYPHSVIRFFDLAPDPRPGATIVKFRYADNVLLDDIWVNGAKVTANLDTGSSGSVQLSPRAVQRLGLKPAENGTAHSSVGYNGAFVSREGKLTSLRIGDSLIANDVDAMFFPPNTGHDRVAWDVNVGNVFLSQYIVTVDYQRKTVTFEK